MMKFRGLIEESVIEWPGKVSVVVFTGGCNFNCPFCQNVGLVQESVEESYTEEYVMDLLLDRKKWIDGLIVSGGEPTLHSDLYSFSSKIKNAGFEFGLETNGSNPNILDELINDNKIDYVSLDIKTVLDKTKYKKAMGIDSNELYRKILESINILSNSDIDYEFRTTAVPGIIEKEELKEIAEQIESKTDQYYIQQFENDITLDDEFSNVEPYEDRELEKIVNEISDHFKTCELRN